ncbi:MAG: addiction module antitoxin [bacterium]|nr:addiction module antitoxin [bacterium]
MKKKLTIYLDEQVFQGLHEVIGVDHISGFIERLVRPHVLKGGLEAAYREMAADLGREAEAQAWTEGLLGDINK